jgi:hypothetical protein
MPITASLGALTFAKLGPATSDNWYLQTNTNIPFVGLVIDPSDNIYVAGTDFLMQFIDLGFIPVQQWATTISTLGGLQGITDFKYSSYYDAIGITYSELYNSTQFPNPIQSRAIWKMVSKTGSIPAFSVTGGNIGVQANAGTNRGIYANTFAINEVNGYYYSVGAQNEFFQLGESIQCNQFSDANNGATLLAFGGVYGGVSVTTALGTGGQVDSNGYLTFVGYIQNSSTRYVVLTKSEKVVTSSPGILLPIWQRKITLTSNLLSSKLILDSSDNTYILVNDGTSTNGYLMKYNSSGVLQWQRRIGSTNLTAIHIDSSSNIYVAGKNSSNNLFIAKYNTSGVIQWQTKLAGATFSGLGIKEIGSNLYVAGSASGKGFIIKLPIDGSIPGDGSYYVGGSLTLTYSVATQTEVAGSLVDASGSEVPFSSTTNPYTSAISGTALAQTNTIISLT